MFLLHSAREATELVGKKAVISVRTSAGNVSKGMLISFKLDEYAGKNDIWYGL